MTVDLRSPDTDPQLLTIPEVASFLSISRERCYELAAKGTIPTVRLSERRIRVPRAWLSEQAAQAMEGRQ